MSDQAHYPSAHAVEEDLRAAHEQVQELDAILRNALAEDERLANQAGGDPR
jgi:hypothetical protein